MWYLNTSDWIYFRFFLIYSTQASHCKAIYCHSLEWSGWFVSFEFLAWSHRYVSWLWGSWMPCMGSSGCLVLCFLITALACGWHSNRQYISQFQVLPWLYPFHCKKQIWICFRNKESFSRDIHQKSHKSLQVILWKSMLFDLNTHFFSEFDPDSIQVLIFLFIFVYALAVVLTRMVGHQKKSEDEDVQEVMDMFSNVGTLSRKGLGMPERQDEKLLVVISDTIVLVLVPNSCERVCSIWS